MKPSLWRKIGIYLSGVLLGLLILRLVPRDDRGDVHPWHAQTAPEGMYPLEVEDDYGRRVAFPRQPRWIVSLAPSVTEMLAALEMEDHLIAVTDADRHPFAEQLKENRMSVGRMDAPDIERIYSLGADVVIGSKLTPLAVYDRAQRSPAPVTVALDARSLDDLLQEDFPTLGRLLGVPTRALEAVKTLRTRRSLVNERLRPVKQGEPRSAVILLGLEDNLAPGWSPGRGTWPDGLLREAHGRNVAAELGSSWGQLPLESLLSLGPEVIFIVDGATPPAAQRLRRQLEALPSHPVWQHLEAVKEGRIVILEHRSMNIPGPGMVDALEALADGLWPEF